MDYKHYKDFTKYNEILRFIKEQAATGTKSLDKKWYRSLLACSKNIEF